MAKWKWFAVAALIHVSVLLAATLILVREPEGAPPSGESICSIELPLDRGVCPPDLFERQGLPTDDMLGVGGGSGGGGGYGGSFGGRSNMVSRGAVSRSSNHRVDETIVFERNALDVTPVRMKGRPRGGELRAKLEEKEVPIPLKHTDVKAHVSIHLASVTVKQQYHNPYDSKIEAVYVFPLPDDAAVRDFIMVVGDRTIRGVIRERDEARRIYEDERAKGHVASLMTQERGNVFSQSVANIEPGKRIDIDITYFHSLKYAEGEYEFHFPMVVGPRYNGSTPDPIDISYLAPDEISTNDITLEVDIDAALPIRTILSPSHVIDVRRTEPSRAKVTLAPHDRVPNKDFVLRYKVGGRGIASAFAVHRDKERGGFFTLVVNPPDTLARTLAPSREMFFVLDVSGSMDGAPIEISKRTMERCLRRLGSGDTFQIITFANEAKVMSPLPIPATPANIKKGIAWCHDSGGGGGTQMLTGVRAALEAPADPERYRIVSFMTDGCIGNENQVFTAVRESIGNARIFSFGIGSSVNRHLIEGLGRLGRGTTAFVGLDETSERAVDALYQQIEHPALTDLRLAWSGGEIHDVQPAVLPDLFAGRPVIITGRFKGEGEVTLTLTGRVSGKPQEMTVKVNLDEPGARHAAMPAMWARARIASISDRMIYAPEEGDLPGLIRKTAIEYGLMSQYTSFVAVDSSRFTDGGFGTTVAVPVPVPAGVKYETTVGEK